MKNLKDRGNMSIDISPKLNGSIPKPLWLRRRLPSGSVFGRVRALLRESRLHTVCEEAGCPNMWECFARETATFMILGDRCTRNCRFCGVTHGIPGPADPKEPERVAEAAARLHLRYIVVTSVTRDDLSDGGAALFAQTVIAICRKIPGARVEVLIPDFQGDTSALQTVLSASPDIVNHNMETVARLYAAARPGADYERSLTLLEKVRALAPDLPTKSGLMLGLGETDKEIHAALVDLRRVDCTILTLGQYLQPSKSHLPVRRYIAPEIFDRWRETALALGFAEAACGPLVRSSYRAAEIQGQVIGRH